MEETKTKIPAVIVDLDGTICETEHRVQKFMRGKKKDWKGFYEAMDLDEPRHDVVKRVEEFMEMGFTILLVSGRPEEYRARTQKWFADKGLGFETLPLFMRKTGDFRPDTIIKKEILDEHIRDKYEINCAIDDRPSVIRMWGENGISVIDVGLGEEF